ncbi:MAG TPA: methyltransferase domain-containing protein [Ktedonobacteraceae bacterium]|nr:methyltransferase domain-containing protein [Ktedonobacteraceae bacterium]
MQGASERVDDSLKYVDLRDFGEKDEGHINTIVSALQFQHKLFLREMGGTLLPLEIPQNDVQVVMDYICGPGAWCIDLSKDHPEKHIYGLDSNHRILAIAQENARDAHTKNIEFRPVNRTPPLLFEDGTFDLIRIQNGTSLFSMDEWPVIMAEMYRLLRPGGWLHMLDFEMGPTSQPALDRVLALLGQIMKKLGRSFSPYGTLPLNGCILGPQRLARQSFTDIKYHFYPVNLGGWNNPIGRAYLNSIVVKPEMILRLAVEGGFGSEDELRPLLREMQRELQQIGFCGAGMLLSSFGRKP